MGISPDQLVSALAIGGTAGGSVLSARAIGEQGEAIERAARLNAQLARREGRERGKRIRRGGRQVIERQVAEVGKSGLRLEGSPLSVIAANAAEIERRAMEAELAGEQGAAVDFATARTARRVARRRSAAQLLSGAGRSLFLGRELL